MTVDLRGKTVLVTGATGLFAAPIARRMVHEGARVIGASRFSDPKARRALETDGVETILWDILDADLSRLPAHADYVLHTAAYVPGSSPSQHDFMEGNAQATGRLMLRYRDAAAFVYCGTASSYAPKDDGLYSENDDLGINYAGAENYAISKIAGEQIVRFLSIEMGIPVVILRIFGLYSQNYRQAGIALLIRRVLAEKPVGGRPGAPTPNCMIHEDDYVEKGIAAFGIASSPPTIINFGGTERTTVEGVAQTVAEVAGVPVIFRDQKLSFPPFVADTGLMETLLGACHVTVADAARRFLDTSV